MTGASRGIGFEVVQQLRAAGKKVIGLARTVVEGDPHFRSVDLAELTKLEAVIDSIIEEELKDASSFTLINNAGTVEPIGKVGHLTSEEIGLAMAVNLTAAIITTNAFIRKLQSFTGTKKVMNISSGAGRNPYEGWGVYCTTKAGLDHFSRVVALEQSKEEHPVEILSIAPGIIDTNMQTLIRDSDPAAFPLLDQFVAYKEKGMLSSPEETARKLISFLNEANFLEVGPIADIRHYE